MRYIWSLCLSVVFLAFSPAWAEVSPPLPAGGIRVTPPSPAMPQEVRDFSGAFRGKIEAVRHHPGMKRQWQEVLLVVERIDPNDLARRRIDAHYLAQIYIAWGDEQGQDARAKAGSKKLTAKIESYAGILRLEAKDKEQTIYWEFGFKEGGALFCKRFSPGDINRASDWQGELKRIPTK